MKRMYGIILLLFYPLVLSIDIVFGELVTGIKTSPKQSAREVWVCWRKLYWDAQP